MRVVHRDRRGSGRRPARREPSPTMIGEARVPHASGPRRRPIDVLAVERDAADGARGADDLYGGAARCQIDVLRILDVHRITLSGPRAMARPRHGGMCDGEPRAVLWSKEAGGRLARRIRRRSGCSARRPVGGGCGCRSRGRRRRGVGGRISETARGGHDRCAEGRRRAPDHDRLRAREASDTKTITPTTAPAASRPVLDDERGRWWERVCGSS